MTTADCGSRRGRRVPATALRRPERYRLAEAKEQNRQRILVNSFGDNWTSSGFRASWRKEMKRLGTTGVTFHDLRGTGISYANANGMDIERIAEISDHSEAECEAIIRKHYLAGGDVIEAVRAGTKGA